MIEFQTTEHRAWRAFLEAHARLTQRLNDRLEQTGSLSLSEFQVLNVLEGAGGRLRMAELADLVLTSRSGLTRRIDRLERRGLVSREPCEQDKRGSFAVLTERGRDVLAETHPLHAREIRRLFFDSLSEQQVEVLARGLEEVAERASQNS